VVAVAPSTTVVFEAVAAPALEPNWATARTRHAAASRARINFLPPSAVKPALSALCGDIDMPFLSRMVKAVARRLAAGTAVTREPG
jgi:hypothetical protein